MRPVALGETGFDRLTDSSRAAMGLQEVAFREQLRLARRFELPVVLHLLKSDEPALRVLREEGLPERGGVVHSFSGAKDFALALVKLGLHVSFCGTLAFPQSRRLREAASVVPLERLLIETDAPDQAPPPYRGTPNRPEHLPIVAQALADVRGLSFAEVARVTRENAFKLFGLPAST
jgi:TatD DNase family protein